MARRLAGIFAISLLAAVSRAAPSPPLDLERAAKFALDNSPIYKNAERTEAVRELEYGNARSRIWPTLSFSATHGLQDDAPVPASDSYGFTRTSPSAPWASSLSLGLTETLYDSGVSLTNISIARLNRELAGVNKLKGRDTLLSDVANAYYKFSLASVLLKIREQQQQQIEKQFKILKGQYEQGFKTRSDYLRLKAQVQRSEIERVAAKGNLTLEVVNLRKLIGADPKGENAEITFEPLAPKTDRNLEELAPSRPPAFESTYEYKASRLQTELANRGVELAKNQYGPQILVDSAFAYMNSDYMGSGRDFGAGDRLSWNALLKLKYDIWDWGANRRRVEIARVNSDIERNNVRQSLLDTGARIGALMTDLERIMLNYKTSRELLALEEESYRTVEAQYRLGRVAYLDLISALDNLLSARVQYYTSYFDAMKALAQYRYFEGTIYSMISGGQK